MIKFTRFLSKISPITSYYLQFLTPSVNNLYFFFRRIVMQRSLQCFFKTIPLRGMTFTVCLVTLKPYKTVGNIRMVAPLNRESGMEKQKIQLFCLNICQQTLDTLNNHPISISSFD